MKKNLSAWFLTLLAVITFSGCSDVPAPYEIMDGSEDNTEAVGDGTKDNPYDVTAMKKQDGSEAWVQGYIVGSVKDKSIASDSEFTGPFTNPANILIAASADELDYKKCMPVQLVSGTDVRTALNLKDNESNLGKVVSIKGTLTAYFGVSGLKSPSAAILDGKEIGEGGGEPGGGDLASLLDPTKTVTSITNKFDDAVNNENYAKEGYVNFAEAGSRVWRGKPFDADMRIQATCFGSKEESNISWFITPAFVVNDLQVKVTFDCISAYYVEGTKLEVYFLEKEGGNVTKTLISVGDIPQNAEGTYNGVVTLSGDLSAFAGKTGFIGFKYTGSSTATGTYQIDNLYVGVEGGGEEPEPGPSEVVVVTKDQPYEETFAASQGAFTIEDISKDAALDYVWAFDAKYGMKASASKKVDNANVSYASESLLKSPVLDLTGLTSVVLTFDQAVNFAKGEAANYLTLVVKEDGKTDWESVAISYPEKDSWNFVSSGDIDLTKYAGKKVQLAFKYKSTAEKSTVWEIKNVKVAAKDGGTDPEPTPGGKYTSNITMPEANWSNSNDVAYGGIVKVEAGEYPVVKLGKTKAPYVGFWSTPALGATKTKLSFYAVGWSGKTGILNVTIEGGGTFEGGVTSKTIDLAGNAGATSNSPYTITPADSDYHELTLTGTTAASTIKFATSADAADKRAIIFGINVD